MRGRQKNVLVMCKGQWFPLIYMTAVKYIYIWQKDRKNTKKLLYFYWTLLWIFIAKKKRVLKLHSWAVFSSMWPWHTVLQMQNSSFWTTDMCRRQNFEIILKVKQQSMEFSFRFHSNDYGFNLGWGQVKNFLMKRGSFLILLVLSHQTPPAPLPHKKIKGA